MLSALIVTLVVLALVVAGATMIGRSRWAAGTEALRARLQAARVVVEPRIVRLADVHDLPPPVARYFSLALRDGQPMVAGVRVTHAGTFNMDGNGARWLPFTSDQMVVTRRPGFDWDGRITMVPGATVHVHDAYVAGEGLLHAALFGAIPLVRLSGAGDLARDELMRFAAEAAWYPTALLPVHGVRWTANGDLSAIATFADEGLTFPLRFTFGDDGLIAMVEADARGRLVEGTAVPTPWRGRFWDYADRDGMRVPLEGDVAWILPDGPRPYWRGRITSITYEFAR